MADKLFRTYYNEKVEATTLPSSSKVLIQEGTDEPKKIDPSLIYNKGYKFLDLKKLNILSDNATSDSDAWNALPDNGYYQISEGISLITSNVTLLGNFKISSVLKPSSGIDVRFQSGSVIYFEGEWKDTSLGGNFLFESGVVLIGDFPKVSATSMPVNHHGFAGNIIDSTSGASYIRGGTDSFPHKLESGCELSVISGGYDNFILIDSIASAINGGAHHRIRGSHGTVGGGAYQEVDGSYGFAGGGTLNKVHSSFAVVGGGQENEVGDPDAADTLVTRSGVIGGGTQNINKGLRGFIGGGFLNLIDEDSNHGAINGGKNNDIINSESGSINGGFNCDVNNAPYGSIIGGSNSRVTAAYGIAGGTSQARGVFAVSTGDFNLADAPRSVAQGGRSKAVLDGQRALANGSFSTNGDRQISELSASRQTTNAATLALGLFAGSQPIVMTNNQSWGFNIIVTCRQATTTDTKVFEFKGAIKKGTTPASAAIIGSVTKTTIAADSAASSWDCDVIADTSNGGMAINVTGETGKTIRWLARIELTELIF